MRIGPSEAIGQSRVDTLRTIMQTIRFIRHLEELQFEAMEGNNLAALDALLGDDPRYAHPDDNTETKSEFLEHLRTGKLRYKSIDIVQVKTRVYGTQRC